jgi:subtilisin family serine protease
MKTKIWRAVILLALAFTVFPFMDTVSFAGGPEYAEGEVIVLLKNNTGKDMVKALGDGSIHALAAGTAKKADAVLEKVYKSLSAQSGYCFAVVKSDVLTTEELIKKLREDSDVVSVSPNFIYPVQDPPAPTISPVPVPAPSLSALAESKIVGKTPNDPRFPEMWNLKKINAPAAWGVSTGDPNVLVAITDSGADGTHEDLAANLDAGLSKNFVNEESPLIDYDGHGSHVTGTILAAGNNKTGVTGVTWNTKGIILKAGNGLITPLYILESLEYLLELVNNGDNIVAVNHSFGGGHRFALDTPEEAKNPDSYEYHFWLAYKTLSDTNKVVIVVAAGNDGIDIGIPHYYPNMDDQKRYEYPACYTDIDNMIVVGAMDETDSGSVWNEDTNSPSGWGATNWSPTLVDIAAPGSQILSTTPGNQYITYNGTSMAAPHVTGGVALLASVARKFDLSLDARDYKRVILESANKKVPELTLNGENLGPIAAHGTLDLRAAVTQLLKEYVPEYEFVPINVDWAGGQPPAPVVGESFTARVTVDRDYKDIAATLISPTGTGSSLWPDVSGSLVEVPVSPSSSGNYTLKFTVTDSYDVEWETSLAFSVGGTNNGGDSDSGGGGGCSLFGTEIFIFAGLALFAISRKPLKK